MKKELIRKDTRNEIIFTAEQLIRERGFNGFSYGDIADRLGIKNAAIHYYFPTKDDLSREVINQEILRIADYRWHKSHLPGNQQLRDFLAVFIRNSLDNKVCLLGTLAGEYPTFDGTMRLTVEDLCLCISEWVRDMLEKGQAEGTLRFEGDSTARAWMVISTLMSGLLLNRVLSDEGVFNPIIDQLMKDLGVDWQVADLHGQESDKRRTLIHSYT